MKEETDISLLLDKYYEGETSPEEESLLAELLAECNDEEVLAEKDMFAFAADSREIELDDDFDDIVFERIASRKINKFSLSLNEYMIIAGSVAAALVLVFIAGMKSFSENQRYANAVKIDNDNYAEMKTYAKSEISSAFDLISEKIKMADEEMDKLNKIQPAIDALEKINVMSDKGNIE